MNQQYNPQVAKMAETAGAARGRATDAQPTLLVELEARYAQLRERQQSLYDRLERVVVRTFGCVERIQPPKLQGANPANAPEPSTATKLRLLHEMLNEGIDELNMLCDNLERIA